MKLALFGRQGKVGRVLGPALEAAGHEVHGFARGDRPEVAGLDAAVDFTTPETAPQNVRACLEQDVDCVLGTTGVDVELLAPLAERRGRVLFHAPNFALGAVLMMRFAEQAAVLLPHAEIIELHADSKRDAPSGTAKATADAMDGDVPIHSVRLPGIVAHQEVLLSETGQLLTIRHDAYSREAYVPGVLLALKHVTELPPGVTTGLDRLLNV